jgi:OOP family OmpA-OmpF porin
VISAVAQALKDNDVPTATVEGHADSISDEAFNQTLSENRADAVTAALRAAGVSTDLTSVGYGKTRSVASNTNPDGSDNPAGRQLNRRVEIYIPTF